MTFMGCPPYDEVCNFRVRSLEKEDNLGLTPAFYTVNWLPRNPHILNYGPSGVCNQSC
jgi:hypothetical protein